MMNFGLPNENAGLNRILRLGFAVGFLCAQDFSAGESARSFGMPQFLIGLFGIAIYSSGFLLWPIRRWLTRRRRVRGKALLSVFLGQFLSYLVVGCLGFFSTIRLEHGYYWFIILILLNVIFTGAGIIAWVLDAAWELRANSNLGAEPVGPANGSQPSGSETNPTSSAAGSRR